MSYTFSITKNRHEPLLEISIKEEIIEHDTLVHSHLERCFERVFQLIKQSIKERKEEEREEEEEGEEVVNAENGEKNFFSTIFN